jgi:hypothetical protein
MLLGAGEGTGTAINLASQTFSDAEDAPTNPTIELVLKNDGIAYYDEGDGDVAISGQWMNPPDAALAGNYEARATLVSGSAPTGSALSTWLVLSSNRTWTKTRTTNGTSSTVLTVEIRDAVSLVVLTTATIRLTVIKIP